MRLMLSRRAALVAASATLVSSKSFAVVSDPAQQIGDLEKKNGGRLGVAILDTKTGRRVEHRASERFAMCSTFKFLASACVLSRVDKGSEQLDRRIHFTAKDLMPNSPITKAHVADGMMIQDLCEATITVSDNTAGNLLLASFGGPSGFTAYARSLGDKVTRLDRVEPELNDVKVGDERDTTTPAAMLQNMRKVVLGDALSSSSRAWITKWIIATKTGDKRLRAGLPKDWTVGDKTGTSGAGNYNDIAVIWPPDRGPLIITAYYSEVTAGDEQANAVIAEVGAIASRWIMS